MADEFRPFDEEDFEDYLNNNPEGFSDDSDSNFRAMGPGDIWNPENAPWNSQGVWRESQNGNGAFRKESNHAFTVGIPCTDGPGLHPAYMLEMVLATHRQGVIDAWPELEKAVHETVDYLKEQGIEKKKKKDDPPK